jgi:simple sugar transport system substrate-binding protein
MKRLSIYSYYAYVFVAIVTIVFAALFASSCKNKDAPQSGGIVIGVFVPGVSSGSPVYEMLVEGVLSATEEYNEKHKDSNKPSVTVTVIEGGFNQAEWENKVTAMAASGSYNLIVSSNPSLPDIVSKVSQAFPKQQFLLLDGELRNNKNVYSLRYNQREQGYMAGYIAALETERHGGVRKVGLVAAQEYPAMNNIILPGFLEGAKAVHPSYEVDFRIVGNWYDAAKASELAADMIQGGVRALLCIAGGANEGAVTSAKERGAKVVWFDSNGYSIKPGTIIGSSVIRQDLAAHSRVLQYLEGSLPFGVCEVMGLRDGYVDFIQDDPVYLETVPADIREKQAAMIERLRSAGN